ncbi:small ribosomal subunit protein uS17m [Ambystoma mexicanum]|uniref:small ribosomal subunit protein uS17m n=1 Tax=Ambystoma mexicanum TaxID=8296 RepID=UPI0037E92962
MFFSSTRESMEPHSVLSMRIQKILSLQRKRKGRHADTNRSNSVQMLKVESKKLQRKETKIRYLPFCWKMSAKHAAVHAKWIVGKVIGTKMPQTAKVRVTRLVLDPYLLKFYNKRKTYFAYDAQQQCTIGDVVLLKALPERRSNLVKHELAEIVYKVGRVIDPMTGKACAGSKWLENLTDTDSNLSDGLQGLEISAVQTEGSEKQLVT